MTGREVAFLGGGKMGEAMISGLIRSGGRSVDEIMVTCRREERARELAGKYGIGLLGFAGTLLLVGISYFVIKGSSRHYRDHHEHIRRGGP